MIKIYKKIIQNFIKLAADILVLPIVLLYCVVARFVFYKKNRVFFGLMPNNNLIYVRDSLKKLGYKAAMIPWIIPEHERKNIPYDMDLKTSYPKLYNNFFGQIILIYLFFFWAISTFEIFIIPFQNRLLDRTFLLKWFEFQLVHIAGKKTILNPYGGDIQYVEVWEGSSNLAYQELYKAWQSDPYYGVYAREKFVLRNTLYCLRYADRVVLSIDWPDYIPHKYRKNNIDYFHMRAFPLLKPKKKEEKHQNIFTIIHATNHSHFKGTKFLELAVEEINKEKKICELIILQNTKNEDVLQKIEMADLVFDQLLLGAYGRLAIEAMSLEKPVICYLRDDLKELYPAWHECPIINANISNLKEKILEVMNMSELQRGDIGKKSKVYAEKYHSPEYVGEKLHAIIQKVLKP